MRLETFFRIITVFGFIAIVVFIANAASAVQYGQVDWGAEFDLSDVGRSSDARLNQIDWGAKRGEWSDVGGCDIHDRCLVITNRTSGVVTHRSFARPQISSKVYRLEKKKRKPIDVESKIKIEGREYDPNDRKLEEKFWELPLEEKRKYPMILRKRFINAKRKREYEEAQKKNPDRAPQPLPPYDEEEMSILRSDNRKPSMAIQLDGKRYGKVSDRSKIGNKVINLEVK